MPFQKELVQLLEFLPLIETINIRHSTFHGFGYFQLTLSSFKIFQNITNCWFPYILSWSRFLKFFCYTYVCQKPLISPQQISLLFFAFCLIQIWGHFNFKYNKTWNYWKIEVWIFKELLYMPFISHCHRIKITSNLDKRMSLK